ncbi:hypothetical protein [Niabella hibiscisoli]|nr:hypothetical protein [Niabella hibiscisoli]
MKKRIKILTLPLVLLLLLMGACKKIILQIQVYSKANLTAPCWIT